jgi:replication-associated recombination protein RarA
VRDIATITTRRMRFPVRITSPTKLARKRFYEPVERGFERELRKRLDYWDKLRRERQNKSD